MVDHGASIARIDPTPAQYKLRRGRHWRPKASRLIGLSVDGLAFGLFALLIVLPLFLVLGQSFFPNIFSIDHPSFEPDLSALRAALSDSAVLRATAHSASMAAICALTTTALGAAFAVILRRTNIPWKRGLALTPWLVFLTPSYLKGLAWVLLMSPGGYLAQLGVLPHQFSNAFFGLGGLVFVHTLNLFPIAFFIIDGALVGLGCEFEDAARLAGATPARIWWRINGPLLAPAVVLSLLAVFAEVLSDFGLAATIARTSDFGVLTYGIYVAASNFPVNFPLAGSQGLLLVSLVLMAVMGDQLLRRQSQIKLLSGRAKPARIYRLGATRYALAAMLGLVSLLAIYLPLAAIAIRSVCRTLGQGLVDSNFTSKFLLQVLEVDEPTHVALLRSLGFAALTAVIATALALFLSERLERASSATRAGTLTIALGTISIPGIVLGFGYILLWNRMPGFRDLGFPQYGSWSLLVVGYIAAALPYALVIVLTASGQIAQSMRDAARLAGVSRLRVLFVIVVPLIGVSLTSAMVLSFLRTVFELPMSQLLTPLSGPAAPAMIVRLFGNDNDGIGSALSLFSMLAAGGISGAVVLISRWLLRRSPRTGEVPADAPKAPTLVRMASP